MLVRCYPGSMGLAAFAMECFPLDNIIVGSWLEPVTLTGITENDMEGFAELLRESPSVEEVETYPRHKDFHLLITFKREDA